MSETDDKPPTTPGKNNDNDDKQPITKDQLMEKMVTDLVDGNADGVTLSCCSAAPKATTLYDRPTWHSRVPRQAPSMRNTL